MLTVIVPLWVNSAVSQQPQDTKNNDAVASVDSTTFLQAGDVIRLNIWREPDMSGEFVVDEHGTVVFPKLGIRKVTDVTVDSLRALLIADYQRFLQNPSINIVFLWRIKVWGAVMKPGLYPVTATTTLTDAVAIAGGVSPNGRTDQIELVRDGTKKLISLKQPSSILSSQVKSGDEIIIPQRSWLSRYPTIIPVAISALVSIVSLLTR